MTRFAALDSLSSLNRRFPVLLILSWLALHLPRPFALGFYHDDWWCFVEPTHATMPFSPGRLRWFVGPATSFGPRPGLGLVAFVVSSLFGSSAFGFQCVSSLLVLAAALSLRSWFKLLLGKLTGHWDLTADLAAILWMSMPWMLGVTAWPVLAQTLVAQILFTEIARLLLKEQTVTLKLAIQLTVGLLACGLVYEAFYFLIFPLIGFYAIFQFGPTRTSRDLRLLVMLSCAAQAIAIAYNRYCATIGGGPTKRFNPQWAWIFVVNVGSTPKLLAKSMAQYASLWAYLLAVLAVASFSLMFYGLFNKSLRGYSSRVLGLFLLGLAVFLISMCTYSLAGYGLASTGVASRTLFSPSFAFTICFLAASAAFSLSRAPILKLLLLVSTVAVIAVMARAQHERLEDWAESWRQERQILAAAPVDQISRIPPDSAIVFVRPPAYKGIPAFDSDWDLTPAVFAKSPLNRNRRPYKDWTVIYPVGDPYTFFWDGTTLVWESPGFWTQRLPAKHLYVWKFNVPGLEEIAKSFTWPLGNK
jgi:hypothetical protein